MNKVDNFRDIPELFIEDNAKETKVSGRHRKTAVALDKMVQFIWDYQQQHNGETPKLAVIAKNSGITNPASATYFMNMLVDDGRVNKISSTPFRVTLTDNPQNKRAIESFRRLRTLRDREEAAERDEIRANQERLARADQRQEDKQALFTAHDVQVMERPAPTVSVAETKPELSSSSYEAVTSRFLTARQESTSATRDLKKVMPQLIKVAETRDLLMELTDRGYVVSKR